MRRNCEKKRNVCSPNHPDKMISLFRNEALSISTNFASCFVLLCVILFFGIQDSNATKLRIKTSPSSVRQRLNEFVQLRCDFNYEPSYINWEFKQGNDAYQFLFRCHLPNKICSNLTEPFSDWPEYWVEDLGKRLIVNRLGIRNNGQYRCTGLLSIDAVIAEANVTVLVEPGPPFILMNDSKPFRENQTISAQCSSKGANPPARFRWTLLRQNSSTMSLTNYFVTTQSRIAFGTSWSLLKLTLTGHDDEAMLLCEVSNDVAQHSSNYTMRVLYKPQISKFGINPLRIIEHSVYQVLCQARANPPAQVYWRKGSKSYPNTFTLNSNYLEFARVERNHRGGYECVASNAIGESSASLLLDVLYQPSVTAPVKVTVESGRELVIDCIVNANPPPFHVQWIHETSGQLLSNQSRLVIKQVTRELVGRFQCYASNRMEPNSGPGASTSIVKTDKHTVIVEVEYKPDLPNIVATSQGGTNIEIGHRVTLLCQENIMNPGFPAPKFQWMHVDSSTIVAEDAELKIDVVRLDHNGVYRCTPHNKVGHGDFKEITLNVNEPALFIEELPNQHTANIEIEDLQLKCVARGKPQPQIEWFQNNVPISTENNDYFFVTSSSEPIDRYSAKVSSILRFHGNQRSSGGNALRSDDNARFTCNANNKIGNVKSEMYLTVLYKPFPLNGASGKLATDIDGNSSVILQCLVSSVPQPTCTWRYNGKDLAMGNKYTIKQWKTGERTYKSSLLFDNAKAADLGIYECNFSNNRGNAIYRTELQKISVPEAAYALKVINTTWDSAEVSWIPGFHGGLPQNYTIELTWQGSDRFTNSAKRSIHLKGGQVPRYNISGLLPSTNYTVRVIGRNALGFGPISMSLDFSTNSLYFPPMESVTIYKSMLTYFGVQGFCIRIEELRQSEKRDTISNWLLHKECLTSANGKLPVFSNTKYRVYICLQSRKDVCSSPEEVRPVANDTISSRDITIVASVCGVVIVILLIVLVYFCCRFKQPKKNSEANSSALRHSHQTLNSSSNYHNVVSVQDHVQSCGYQPVATLCSPTTTDCRFEESSTLGRGADSPLKAASVGGKPYALVTPHPSQQQLHFDNMALSPSDPYGKMFATNQSARDPLDSNQVYRLNMTTDFSQEQYLAGLMTSSGQKAKKVVYEVVV